MLNINFHGNDRLATVMLDKKLLRHQHDCPCWCLNNFFMCYLIILVPF